MKKEIDFNEIVFRDNDKILFFERRNRKLTWDFYKEITINIDLNRVFYRTISEYKGSDYYIDLKDSQYFNQGEFFWNEFRKLNIYDLTCRCRVLRNLPIIKSRDLILRAFSYFLEFFNKNKFDYLITYTSDSYITELIIYVAKLYKIKVYAIGGAFIENTKRITEKGEIQFISEKPKDFVEKIRIGLQNKMKVVGKPSKKIVVYRTFKYTFSILFRYIYHYIILHKLFGKLNYDYLLAGNQLEETVFSKLFFFKFIKINQIDDRTLGESIYIPLHFYPEATVDYWSDSPEKSFYLESLCEILAYFRERNVNVYLKEHPAIFLRRPLYFYKTLMKYSNCKIIAPFEETAEIFKVFDKVIIWTGTTGLEAAMNNVNVYLYSKNYWDLGFFKHWKNYTEKSIVSDSEKDLILRNFLNSLVVVDDK